MHSEHFHKMEHVSLIDELIQGKELAKQLSDHLVSSSSPSSQETNEFLLDKILLSYQKALATLKRGSNAGESPKTISCSMMDSHCSFTSESPRSEVMDLEFQHQAVLKKRKTMPRWTEQVKICSGSGHEGSLDDGYGWRKYGQKSILGAKFPRGYYRCTHRNVQGCLATKQVQRSDEDPTIIEVTYRGRHTCKQVKHLNKKLPAKVKMELGENQVHNDQKNQLPLQEKIQQTPAIFMFKAEVEDKTEELETKEDINIFPCNWFFFPSPSIGSGSEDTNILSHSMMENHFIESFAAAFIPPVTSESNLLCLSAYNSGNSGLSQNVQTSESDISEIVSAPTSVTNSPILDLDILLPKGEFDSDFPFNTPEYFSSLNFSLSAN